MERERGKFSSNDLSLDFRKLFEAVTGSYLVLSKDLIIVEASDGYLQRKSLKREEVQGRNIFSIYPYNFLDPSDKIIENNRASLIEVIQNKRGNVLDTQKFSMTSKGPEKMMEERYWCCVNTPILGKDNEVVHIIHRLEDITEFVHLEQKISEQRSINEKLRAEIHKIEPGITFSEEQFYISPAIKILLVDDNEASLYATEQVLSNEEYQIRKASSGIEALKILLNEQDFSLILMDVNMPEINGIETAAMIYERDKLKHIPIIFITGTEYNDALLFKGYKTGGVDYIYKPVDPELLRAKVNVFVDLYRKNHLLIAHEQRLKQTAYQMEETNKELAHANSELEAFTYSVSHDLRAPLRAIDGYARILLEDYYDKMDEEGEKNLDRIIKNTQKMSVLIDNLLHLSRVGRKELIKDHVDMNNMVNSVLSESIRQTKDRNIIIDLKPLSPAMADMNLIKQVWVNLISNAIKFTKTRERAVLEIGSEEKDGETIYYIKDNGVGFDMDHSNKLFGVFQRLHTENEFEGTGVGLAIVFRIIERHGGTVWAKSEVNKGASFYFSLPPP